MNPKLKLNPGPECFPDSESGAITRAALVLVACTVRIEATRMPHFRSSTLKEPHNFKRCLKLPEHPTRRRHMLASA